LPRQVVLVDAKARAVIPREDPVPNDPAVAYALGFTWLSAGRSNDALRAFHAVIVALLATNTDGKRHDKLSVEQGLTSPIALGGEKVAVGSEGGVLIASAATGRFERLLQIPDVYSLESLGSGLVAALTTDGAVLLDPGSATIVERIPHAQNVTGRKTTFAVYGLGDTGVFIDLWDAPTRSRTRTLTEASLAALMMVELHDDARSIAGRDGDHGFVWDLATGAVVVKFNSHMGANAMPAFSADGRFIAYGTANLEKWPTVGTTFLHDTKQHKVVATSHASHYPSGFAFGGKWLAVGDLRKACLLTVPQMSLVACSAEVRPSAGVDDDLQDTQPTFVDAAHALVIATSDGSVLVASVPSMATVWKGRASLSAAADGTGYLVDTDNHELWSLGQSGVPVRVRTLEEDESAEHLRETHPHAAAEAEVFARVGAASCHVGRWVFPVAACTAAR
jgi:hypothetical protein